MANWPQVSVVYRHNLATAQKLEVLHYITLQGNVMHTVNYGLTVQI